MVELAPCVMSHPGGERYEYWHSIEMPKGRYAESMALCEQLYGRSNPTRWYMSGGLLWLTNEADVLLYKLAA